MAADHFRAIAAAAVVAPRRHQLAPFLERVAAPVLALDNADFVR
jgi:hypothetical protein